MPPPELNPLLNPVLGDHMGRWAQAYFTSPPEKREQAVTELLRELEAESSARAQNEVAAPSFVAPSSVSQSSLNPSWLSGSSVTEQMSAPVGSPASPPPEVQLVRCHACGRKNPSSQKFCGMCGTRLGDETAVAELHRDELHRDDIHAKGLHHHDEPRHIADLYIEDQHFENLPPDEPVAWERNQERRDHDRYQPRLNNNELSLFQSIRNDSYNDDYADDISSVPQSSGSYRIYLGIVMVIMLGAVAYMGWRGAQTTSRSTDAAPLSDPARTTEPATSAPVPSGSSNPASSNPASSAEGQASPARNAAKPVRTNPVRSEASTTADNNAPTLAHGISRPEKIPPAAGFTGTGAEELALAERYLSGTNGQGRNSAEAAKWLWKAMAKHNAGAPLLLSDLYLKGDGVPKNCDQARILLDAAALRGVKDAGPRLRHLQAFGCQ